MRQTYSEEFKAEAVSLALSSDKSYAVIARDLGVNYQTFGNWMRLAMINPSAPKQRANKPDYQELERQNRAMKKELDLRGKEIELLKKAAVYFANLKAQGTR